MRERRLATSKITLWAFAGSLCFFACKSESKVEPLTKPQAKKEVRKLYAPGADESAAKAAPAQPQQEQGQADLKAALLGTNKPKPTTQPEEKVAPAVAKRQRSKQRRAAPQPRDDRPLREEVEAPSGLSDGAFQAAIGDWRGMKRCLRSEAARLESRNGALRVAFKIRGDGSVADSRVVETSNDTAKAIASCVEKRARRIRFPAFAKAENQVEKVAKFVF